MNEPCFWYRDWKTKPVYVERDPDAHWWWAGIFLALFLLALYSAMHFHDLWVEAQMELETVKMENALLQEQRDAWKCNYDRKTSKSRGVSIKSCVRKEGF